MPKPNRSDPAKNVADFGRFVTPKQFAWRYFALSFIWMPLSGIVCLYFAASALDVAMWKTICDLSFVSTTTGLLYVLLKEHFQHASRAQALANVHELRFKAAFESAACGMAVVSPEGSFVSANEKLAHILGMPRSELLGRSIEEFTFPEDRERVKYLAQTALDGITNGYDIERRCCRPDDKTCWASIHASLIRHPSGAPKYFVVIAADISKRKIAEHALRENEERSQLAMRGANDGLWDWNSSSAEIYYSPRWKSMLGYGSEELGNTIDTWKKVVHPDDRDRSLRRANEWLSSKSDFYEIEYRLRHKDGHYLDVLSRAYCVRDAEGKAKRAIGTNIDITVHKRAEAALIASESFHATTIEALSEGVIVLAPDGSIVSCNAAARRILRLPFETMKAYHLDFDARKAIREDGSILSIEERPSYLALNKGISSRSEVIGYVNSEDLITWLLINAEPIRDPNSELAGSVVLSFADITERKQAEFHSMTLRENLAAVQREGLRQHMRFNTVFDCAPDAIILVNLQRRLTFMNSAFCRIFGYEPDELNGADMHIISATQTYWPRLAQVGSEAQAQQQCYCGVYSFKRKTGETFPGQLNSAPLKDEVGNIVGFVAIIHDITLEQARNKSLAKSNRLESLGRLTGGVAHDFNNLLTVISTNLQLINMLAPAENIAKKVAAAEQAAEMGARLNQRLMTFAQQRQLDPKPVNLNQLLDGMRNMLERSLGHAHAVKVELDLMPDLPRVNADPSELENTILNLAINARDAMPNGGTLKIQTRRKGHSDTVGRCEKQSAADPCFVTIVIADNGTGMKADVLARSFEPFFTTKESGTGLGLATVHGFVKQSGGHIAIESHLDRGTTITIELPAAEFQHDAPVVLGKGEKVHPKTILVVEDNKYVRESLSEGLKNFGYQVLEADCGNAALDIVLGTEAVDLIFSDVVMLGGMSGIELANQVRSLRPKIKVILTSGFAGKFKDARIRNEMVLAKPYKFEALTLAIKEALSSTADQVDFKTVANL